MAKFKYKNKSRNENEIIELVDRWNIIKKLSLVLKSSYHN